MTFFPGGVGGHPRFGNAGRPIGFLSSSRTGERDTPPVEWSLDSMDQVSVNAMGRVNFNLFFEGRAAGGKS